MKFTRMPVNLHCACDLESGRYFHHAVRIQLKYHCVFTCQLWRINFRKFLFGRCVSLCVWLVTYLPKQFQFQFEFWDVFYTLWKLGADKRIDWKFLGALFAQNYKVGNRLAILCIRLTGFSENCVRKQWKIGRFFCSRYLGFSLMNSILLYSEHGELFPLKWYTQQCSFFDPVINEKHKEHKKI